MGEDYPSETFRVLKENEIRPQSTASTARSASCSRPTTASPTTAPSIPRASRTPSTSRSCARRCAGRPGLSSSSWWRAPTKTPLPALFVEGATDKLIVEAAWRALFPGEPMPFTVLAAGGTDADEKPRSGKAARSLALDRTGLALADNDGEGRDALGRGQLQAQGGRRLEAARPTACSGACSRRREEFRQVMERFEIPAATGRSRSRMLPRGAAPPGAAEGAYAFADHKLFTATSRAAPRTRGPIALRELDEADDAYFYLLRPAPRQAKDAFAAWVADPARLTSRNFATVRNRVDPGSRSLLVAASGKWTATTPAAAYGMNVSDILSQIDLGSIALPEFQRGYVWNRDQVRALMQSLYRRYPVGSLLVWTTRSEGASTRGDGAVAPGVVELLLDGQQRMTSLYGIIRGKPPEFFDGNAEAFTRPALQPRARGVRVLQPAQDEGRPALDRRHRADAGRASASFIERFMATRGLAPTARTYINRLTALDGHQATSSCTSRR